uniref:Trophoblast glycoprotein n=1 Tax=Leptobrachium leishanense TaxID=445787 RepID=A0A8C5PYN8_9ANUR
MVSSDLFYVLRLWKRDRRSPGLSGDGKSKRGVLLALVLVHVFGMTWSQQQSNCPVFCECSDLATTVKCVNKNLRDLPQNFPSYVKNLFITGNNITSLQNGSFKQPQPLLDLANLNLSGNHLHELHDNVFSSLPNLRQLDLSHNALESIENHTFDWEEHQSGPLQELNLSNSFSSELVISQFRTSIKTGVLSNLRKLDLSGNNMYYLPTGTFSSLPSLKHLDLSNNSLVSLQPGIFTNLSQLQTLDLSNNALKCLRNSTLFDLPTQPGLLINLNDNSWVCDCLIEDFARWLKETTVVEGASTLSCSFPEKIKDTLIVSLKYSELECISIDDNSLQTSYVFLGIVLALIGVIFLLVLYLNRKGIKKWMYNIRDACRDHMEGYHYRYEINADPRLTNLSTNSDV